MAYHNYQQREYDEVGYWMNKGFNIESDTGGAYILRSYNTGESVAVRKNISVHDQLHIYKYGADWIQPIVQEPPKNREKLDRLIAHYYTAK